MKKKLVLAIMLICGFLNPQINSTSLYVSSGFSGSIPIVFAADAGSTANTPATAEDTSTPAAAPEEKKIDPLYPDLGSAESTATATCSDVEGSAGFIPCGRYTNDPATPWDECAACDFCSIPLAAQLVTDFAIKIAGVATVLAIVLGQLLAMTAIGQTDVMIKIKSVLGMALMGFGYIFAAWVLVNSILAFIGYTDPLDGQWYTVC